MRKLSSDIDIMQEAFRAGKTKEMIPKILRVLSKRTGVKFYNQDADVILPEEYKNSAGKFLGFRVFMSEGKAALRFNVKAGSSERIVSIDYYMKISDTPTYTIEIPEQFNIIDILGQMELILNGEYFDLMDENQKINNKKKLKEKVYHKELILEFLQQNPSAKDKIVRRGTNWDDILDEYVTFLDSKNMRVSVPSKGTFQIYCGAIVKEMGDSSGAENIPHVNVTPGERGVSINTDTESEEIFNDQIVNNEHVAKYDYMEWIFDQIKKGNKTYNGVYLYGQGGIGKSYTAEQILKPLPNCFYFEGVIQGYTGLLQLLYDHRDNEIIVLDDTIDDKNMNNTTVQNILKLAMLPRPPNRIQVAKKATGGRGSEPSPATAGATMDVPVSGDEDLVDFTSDAGVIGDEFDSPEDFQFDSWLVFITNYPELPQPIRDRVTKIEFIFSNEQISDIIERAVAACEPHDVPLEKKVFTLNWLREHLRAFNATLSFRFFARMASLYHTAPPASWEEWALIELKAG